MARPRRRTLAPDDPVGPFLQALRLDAGLTMEQVAAKLGTGRARLSRVEGGKEPRPSWAWICRFAAACGFELRAVAEPKPRRPA